MNNNLKLCILYLILVTWFKAGLAGGFPGIILSILGLTLLVTQLFQNYFWTRRYFLSIIPLLLMLIWAVIGFNNPKYQALNAQDLIELNMEGTLIETRDSTKIEMISNGMNLILEKSRDDPKLSIALFFHLKNTYTDKYSKVINDPIITFFNNCENKIKLDYWSFLPSISIKNLSSIQNFLFLFINLFFGIIIFHNLFNFSNVKVVLWIVVINTFILCIVGLYQKFTQVWSDDYLEILGIWNAPEPRYFFSTFTYKNHWSAFALISLSCIYSIFYKQLRITNEYMIKSPILLFIIFSSILLVSTVIFSGSRSGILFSVISVILFSLIIFFKKKKLESYSFKKIILYFLVILPTLFFIFYSLKKDEKVKEMLTNSTTQWKALQEGSPPLRWYLWNDAYKMAQSELILGHGYNAFPSTYPKFQSMVVRQERGKGLASAHNPYIPLVAHAHNDVVEFICEWGLLGTFCFFIPYILHIIKVWGSTNSTTVKLLLSGCFVFLVYCFVDFPTRTPACVVLFSCIAGLACKYDNLSTNSQRGF